MNVTTRSLTEAQLVKALLLVIVILLVAVAGALGADEPEQATFLTLVAGFVAIAYRSIDDPAYKQKSLEDAEAYLTNAIQRTVDRAIEVAIPTQTTPGDKDPPPK